MFSVFLSKQSERFLSKIPKKHASQIVAKIDQLAKNHDSVPSKQLDGFPQYRRIKSGEYRMIYRLVGNVFKIFIVRIGKRNDDEVYKNLESLENDPE